MIFLLKYLLRYSFNECYIIYLCVLNNIISSCNCIVPNVRVTVNNELGNMWKNAVVA